MDSLVFPEGTGRLDAARLFFEKIPHSRRLGLEVTEVTERTVTALLPYRPEIVGSLGTGQVHGGAITTLIDQTSGAAAAGSLERPEPVATLDLRVDHLRPAVADHPVYARAECYRITSHIAFVRCVAWQQSPDSPVATSMSSFMRIGGRRGDGK